MLLYHLIYLTVPVFGGYLHPLLKALQNRTHNSKSFILLKAVAEHCIDTPQQAFHSGRGSLGKCGIARFVCFKLTYTTFCDELASVTDRDASP